MKPEKIIDSFIVKRKNKNVVLFTTNNWKYFINDERKIFEITKKEGDEILNILDLTSLSSLGGYIDFGYGEKPKKIEPFSIDTKFCNITGSIDLSWLGGKKDICVTENYTEFTNKKSGKRHRIDKDGKEWVLKTKKKKHVKNNSK